MTLMNLDEVRTLLGVVAPTRGWWVSEVASGWPGSNGSSMSTDHIFGVRIGITSSEYSIAKGPADLHDFGYRVLRRMLWMNSLSSYEAETIRKRVDDQMYDGLISLSGEAPRVAVMTGAYRIRCYARWFAVRWVGSRCIVPIPTQEGYYA